MLHAFALPHSELVFRGVADVIYSSHGKCPGGLWEITKECEETLDVYEGIESGLYRKVWLKFKYANSGKIRKCLTYQMQHDGIMPPSQQYVDTIAQGYVDFDLDLQYLDHALMKSWNDKDKTDFLRRRHKQRGGGQLAREVSI
jgi:hypothetical protein